MTWELRVEGGSPKAELTQNLPDFSYARFAESIGLLGIRVGRPEDVAGAWETALAADRPVVLEAFVSGAVPTLPPHITLEQAHNYTSALLRGDPEEGSIIKQSVKSVVEGIFPHKSEK